MTQQIKESRMKKWVAKTAEIQREKIGLLEGVVSIVLNVFIAAIKFFYGIIFHSISLIADAVHSLSDVFSSVVVIVGFKIAAKPADEDHPFGHGRMELIASVIVATLLFVVGIEFLKDSVGKIMHPEIANLNATGIAVVAFTLLIKEGMARFSFFLGREIDSSVLIADGHHHRSDAISTVLVLFSLLCVKAGLNWADGAGGLLVSVFIMYTAYGIVRDSASPLIGQMPSREMIEKIRSIALTHREVFGVHDIVVHDFRAIYNISLHIEVDHQMSLSRSHEISDAIEIAIQKCYTGWTVVHVDPVDRSHPKYVAVTSTVSDLSKEFPFLETVHDVRIVGSPEKFNIVFDVNVEKQPERLNDIREIKKRLGKRFGGAGVVVNIDPPSA